MTGDEINFIDAVKRAYPDATDVQRAEKIIADLPGDATDPVVEDRRSKKAITQLNRITDLSKFRRRVKAFIDKGIKVDFSKCKVYKSYTTVEVTNYLNNMARNTAEIMSPVEFDFGAELVL